MTFDSLFFTPDNAKYANTGVKLIGNTLKMGFYYDQNTLNPDFDRNPAAKSS